MTRTTLFGILLALSPVLTRPALAEEAPPSLNENDPLALALDDFATAVRSQMAGAYRSYEKAMKKEGEDIVLPDPKQSLDRYAGFHALRALPAEWVEVLNARGGELQTLGATKESQAPESVEAYKHLYLHDEPPGTPMNPVKVVPVIEEKWSQEPEYQPPFGKLAILAGKRDDPVTAAEYAQVATEVQGITARRAEMAVLAALGELREAIEKRLEAVDAEAADPRKPWEVLGSEILNSRAAHHLAERFYKGRWLGHTPQDLTQGEETHIEGEGDPALNAVSNLKAAGEGEDAQGPGTEAGTPVEEGQTDPGSAPMGEPAPEE